MSLIQQILLVVVIVSFFIAMISFIMGFIFSTKMWIFADKIKPQLAKEAYLGNLFERAAKARELGKLLRENYPEYARLEKINTLTSKIFAVLLLADMFLVVLIALL